MEDPPSPLTIPKREAQLGTPDRDAAARSKRVNAGTSGSSVVSAPAAEVTVEKIEMSPATVALLRHMMRDEIKLGISEIQASNAQAITEIKKDARKELDKRIAALEEKRQSSQHTNTETRRQECGCCWSHWRF